MNDLEVAPAEGEVVEYLTVEKAEKLTSDIIDAFDSMREFAEIARASVRKAIDHQVWVTLGYESFEAYAKDRFAACHAHANEMIEALAGEFSSRTIAAVTGKSQSTVARRVSQIDSVGFRQTLQEITERTLAVVATDKPIPKVTGTDGVKRPAKVIKAEVFDGVLIQKPIPKHYWIPGAAVPGVAKVAYSCLNSDCYVSEGIAVVFDQRQAGDDKIPSAGYTSQRRIEQMSNEQLDSLVKVATESIKTLQSFIRRIESERKRATRTEAAR
jgi:hypothetical protein